MTHVDQHFIFGSKESAKGYFLLILCISSLLSPEKHKTRLREREKRNRGEKKAITYKSVCCAIATAIRVSQRDREWLNVFSIKLIVRLENK